MSHALDTAKVTRAMLSVGGASQPKRAPRVPWTAEELAVLDKHYRLKGATWCAEKVGRTPSATAQAARARGLTQHWTAAELVTLRAEWGTISERRMREKLHGRTWSSITRKAMEIGLRAPNQGLLSIKQAEERTGLDRRKLRAILVAAGVPVRRRIRSGAWNTKGAYRQHVVAEEDLTAAVSAWLTADRAKLRQVDAAALTGVTPLQMRAAMLLLRAIRPVAGLPEGRAVWSVSREDATAAAAQYRDRSRCWLTPGRSTAGVCALGPARRPS